MSVSTLADELAYTRDINPQKAEIIRSLRWYYGETHRLSQRITELERASQPGSGEAWREILAAIVREMPRQRSPYNGNAPGHAHERPGIWDGDNGELSGQPCAWCKTWKLARASLDGRS